MIQKKKLNHLKLSQSTPIWNLVSLLPISKTLAILKKLKMTLTLTTSYTLFMFALRRTKIWIFSGSLGFIEENCHGVWHARLCLVSMHHRSHRVHHPAVGKRHCAPTTVIVGNRLPVLKVTKNDCFPFIAMSGENRENTLFYSEIPKTINRAAVLMLSWKPLLDLFQVGLSVVVVMILCMFLVLHLFRGRNSVGILYLK